MNGSISGEIELPNQVLMFVDAALAACKKSSLEYLSNLDGLPSIQAAAVLWLKAILNTGTLYLRSVAGSPRRFNSDLLFDKITGLAQQPPLNSVVDTKLAVD